MKRYFILVHCFFSTMPMANAEIYERNRVLEVDGDCAYVESYWTGGFSQRYYKGWVCAETVSTKEYLENRLRAARAYYDNPANRPQILSKRMREIEKYQSNARDKWQKQCGEIVKRFYNSGMFDYKGEFESGYCDNSDNVWSIKCINSLIDYQYSPFVDEYEHNRINGLESCGSINNDERFKFLEFLKKQFVRYNVDSGRIITVHSSWIMEAKYVKNKFNRKCIELTVSKKKGIRKIAEACAEINTQNSLNRVKSFINTHSDFTADDILILSK